MLIARQEWITRKDLQKNPRSLYIFGDNLMRVGLGGQAKEMRGEPNAFGIATKRTPRTSTSAYFFDHQKDVKGYIDEDLLLLKDTLKSGKYDVVVLPQAGIGSGLAEMHLYAPTNFKYLNKRMMEIINNV